MLLLASYISFTCCQVHKVFPSGLASEEGTIQKGDELLSINGQSLKEVTHSEGTAILRQARMLKQAVIVICKSKESDTGNDESSESSMTTSAVENPSVTGKSDWGISPHHKQPQSPASLFMSTKFTNCGCFPVSIHVWDLLTLSLSLPPGHLLKLMTKCLK